MLELSHLSAGYGEKTVLRDVSFTLPRGTLTAIVGPNGSGKSTLLKTALGILPPKQGAVLLDGAPISQIKRTCVAKRISYLAQSTTVPDMTVYEAVLHGRFPHLSYPRRYRESDRIAARAAMERTGVLPYADTRLSSLSGGERQNALIAMALAQDTDILLLDEPTASLDVRHAYTLLGTLKALTKEEKAVAVVMHDLPLAFSFCDKVAVLAERTLLAHGTPHEVLSSGAVERAFGVALSHTAQGYFYRY